MKLKNTKRSLCALLVVILAMTLVPVVNSFAAKEMFQISAVAVTGIDAPLAGAKPDYTAEVASQAHYELVENAVVWEEYDAGWEWVSTLSANSTFKKGYWYVAFVTLKAKDGYGFTSSVTGTINGISGTVSASNGVDRTVYCSFQCTDTAITTVELNAVMPVIGKTPTFAKADTLEYESANVSPRITNQTNGVVWTNKSTGVNLTVSNPFKKSATYTLTYTLFPKRGFKFASNVKATINGKAATVLQMDGYLAVMLDNLTPSSLTIQSVAITNVTAPVVGKTPSYNFGTSGSHFSVADHDSEYWANGIGWIEFVPGNSTGNAMKKTDTFKAGYKYAVIMDVKSTTDGYFFVKGSTAATVNGKSATLNVDADGLGARLIYTFPALSAISVSKVELNVTAPAGGAKPTFDKIDGSGYYSDNNGNSAAAFKNGIAWFKTASSYIGAGTTETFEAGKDYTLKICLVPKDNYVFKDNMTATINGKTATVTAFDDGSVLLEVVLSAPKAPHTHTPSGWQTDDEYHWKVCTDTGCGSIIEAKKMHLNTDADGKCDTCGYQLPIEVPDDPVDPPVTDPTDPPVVDPTDPPADDPTDPPVVDPTDPPADDPTDPPAEDPAKPAPTTPADKDAETPAANNGWVWIVLGVAVAVLAVAVVLFVKKKK